jgi:hypothetical protein
MAGLNPFTGHFVGAFMTAVLMFYTTQYTFGAGSVGLVALTTLSPVVIIQVKR